MIPNQSTGKFGKSPLSMLCDKKQKMPTIVSPALQQVGKIAAGVATVSTGLLSSGSATGNPRNKYALQRGHSLMDWIRLGSSGKDLTGVGASAGKLSVTKKELSKHNKIDDIWLAIRGKVYNVTAYVPFHPGGPDELMRAAGIDATRLFDQVHPWVNYDQILQKCLVGKLVTVDPTIDINTLFGPNISKNNCENSAPKQSPTANSASSLTTSEATIAKVDSPLSQDSILQDDETQQTERTHVLPRFDWIQRLDYITIIFYTRAFSNPLVKLYPPDANNTFVIKLIYDDFVFSNEILFYENVIWPCSVKVTCETGKVELMFQKVEGRVWEHYGILRQQSSNVDESKFVDKYTFVFTEKLQVNHNISLIRLERTDGVKIVTPIGTHVRAFVNIDGLEWSRSYTPVPESLFDSLQTHIPTSTSLCLMIKRYKNGTVSRYITDRHKDDMVYLTMPLGNFDLSIVEKGEVFLMLAAGTGITPMFGLILFLLERRVKKCQFLRLLFFNKSQRDIPFREQFELLQENDSRLRVMHILSEPDDDWTGLTGHVNKEIIENSIFDYIKSTGYMKSNILTFICGPNQFNTLTINEIKQLDISEDQIYTFQG